jgi:hypothetical protein
VNSGDELVKLGAALANVEDESFARDNRTTSTADAVSATNSVKTAIRSIFIIIPGFGLSFPRARLLPTF